MHKHAPDLVRGESTQLRHRDPIQIHLALIHLPEVFDRAVVRLVVDDRRLVLHDADEELGGLAGAEAIAKPPRPPYAFLLPKPPTLAPEWPKPWAP